MFFCVSVVASDLSSRQPQRMPEPRIKDLMTLSRDFDAATTNENQSRRHGLPELHDRSRVCNSRVQMAAQVVSTILDVATVQSRQHPNAAGARNIEFDLISILH